MREEKLVKEKICDPKCCWALRHMEMFPVEINSSDYYILLRVPGIGIKSARRIVSARRYAALEFSQLKKMGVKLELAVYFITCNGERMYGISFGRNFVRRQFAFGEHETYVSDELSMVGEQNMTYRQLSLFDETGEEENKWKN